jgi:hypothetical protein
LYPNSDSLIHSDETLYINPLPSTPEGFPGVYTVESGLSGIPDNDMSPNLYFISESQYRRCHKLVMAVSRVSNTGFCSSEPGEYLLSKSRHL